MSKKQSKPNFVVRLKNKIVRFLITESGQKVLSSVLAILFGLGLGLLLMVISSPIESPYGFFILLTGGFQKGLSSLGDTIALATPIIITGLSVGFAFRTGLFNIGATGQMTMGAFGAVFVGYYWTFLPGHLHWMVAVLAAIMMGMIWGVIPGILKAIFNVHEVVVTIMMNYIAMYLVVWGVKQWLENPDRSESWSVAENAVLPTMFLDKLFPNSSINSGFILAILAVIVVYIILNKTTFGYQLKVVGHNRHAARYAGINDKRNIIFSMAIAGALAGLAGAVVYLTDGGAHIKLSYALMGQGFDGIAVALLGLSNPIGVFAAGLYFGYLKEAGFFLQRLSYSQELIEIIIAAIIYLSALATYFNGLAKKIVERLRA